MGQMVKEGKFKGGIVHYGYRLEKTGRTNKSGNEVCDIFTDDYESTIVKLVFQKYALEGIGIHRLAMYLTEGGMLPRKGISWHPSTLLHLLKNIQYQGILRSGDSQSEFFDELRIVADTLFNKAQKLIITRNKKSDPKRTAPMSTLGKILFSDNCFCAHCGGRPTPSSGGGKRARADGRIIDRTRNRYSCYNSASCMFFYSVFMGTMRNDQRIEKAMRNSVGMVELFLEPDYPNILFAKDGKIFNLEGQKAIVLGGAYSVDKFYRLAHGWKCWQDEQPSPGIKAYAEK